MTESEFKLTLRNEADYKQWLAQVLDEYAGQCQDLYPNGLIGWVVADDYWSHIPGNRTLDGFIIPKPVVNKPNDLSLLATHAVVARYNQELSKYSITVTTLVSLKKKLLTSIGDTNARFISDSITGTRFLTALQIMTQMERHYNTASDTTIQAWKDALKAPMTEANFRDYASAQKELRDQLLRANQTVSNYDAVQFIIQGTLTHPAIVESIKTYKTLHPRISDQNILDLVDHIILHAPNNATAASLGYANAANGMMSPETVARLVKEARDKGIKEGRNRANEQSGKSTIPSDSKIPHGAQGTKYCHHHGYTFHLGSECRNMTPPSSGYTAAQKNATSPTSPPGGNTKINYSNRN